MLPLTKFYLTCDLKGLKNATYISPSTQNDIIHVIGYDLILSGIVSEVKAACFLSILADEASCHNMEHMPICLRVIDKECDIQEEFVGFIKLQWIKAVDIVDAVIVSKQQSIFMHTIV